MPAKLKVWIANETYDLGEHLVNAAGVPAFNWQQFDPMGWVGRSCRVNIKLLTQAPYEFESEALLTCEQTIRTTSLGIAFKMAPEDTVTLNAIVAAEGILPAFARKLPRIPFTDRISMMPSRAIVFFSLGGTRTAIVTTVENLSPSGLQVTTEDLRALVLIPGTGVQVELQPRGKFGEPVVLNTEIKRIIYATHPTSRNSVRTFGLGIVSVPEEEKARFTQLLKLMVAAMRELTGA